MSLGKIKIIKVVLVIFFCNFKVIAEDKILTVPLVNLENLEPSYEEVEIEDSNKEINQESKIKKKNKKKIKNTKSKH